MKGYWIGLYKDDPHPQEKTGWRWLDGHLYNTSLDVLWGGNSPSGGENENCARKLAFRDKWFDTTCDITSSFICKIGEHKNNVVTFKFEFEKK